MRMQPRRRRKRCEGQGGPCGRLALYRYHGGAVHWGGGHTLCFGCYRAQRDHLRGAAGEGTLAGIEAGAIHCAE